MNESKNSKPKRTVRDKKLRAIEILKAEFGSSPLIDQLQREVESSDEPDSKNLMVLLNNRPIK